MELLKTGKYKLTIEEQELQRRKEEREQTGKRNARPKRTTLTSPSSPSSAGKSGSFRKFQKFNVKPKLTCRNYLVEGSSDSETDDAQEGSLESMYENPLMNNTGKTENPVSFSFFGCCSTSSPSVNVHRQEPVCDPPQHFESDVSICIRRIDQLQRASVLRSAIVPKPVFAEQISAPIQKSVCRCATYSDDAVSDAKILPSPKLCHGFGRSHGRRVQQHTFLS